MLAAVVRQKGGPFILENVDIDQPSDDEVLVRIKAAGICHSNISYRDQVFPALLPQVFGHEGAGGVGLSAIMAAKYLGCNPIIAVDLHADQLELSLSLGATHVINASSEGVLKTVHSVCPRGVDFSVECSGSAKV